MGETTTSLKTGWSMKTAENSREALDLYFKDISSSTPLSSKEEVELAEKIREGNEEARNSLVSANLRYVVRVATEYRGCGMSMEDLIGSGNLGLITAAERFDPDRNVRFITYATWWIRHAIQRSLSYDSRTVRLPTNKLRLLHSITDVTRRLGNSYQSEPGAHDVAEALNISVEKVRAVLVHAQETSSLDTVPQDSERSELMLNLPDLETELPDVHVGDESDRQEIDSILNTLGEREATVLRKSYGLDGGEPMTLEEIGKTMKVTKERVRQIRERAFAKLRHPRRRVRLDVLRQTM
jgi:RNA polymerase primary sigma factor